MYCYNLQDIKTVLYQFESQLSQYSWNEYKIDDFTKVILIEDSLVLLVSITQDKDYCVADRYGTNLNYGNTIYNLEIEEVSYNDIGFKCNHTEIEQFVHTYFGTECDYHVQYTKFKGYTRLYWCPNDLTAAEYVDGLLPHLKLRERYDSWCGVKYYLIVLEFTDRDLVVHRAVAYTTQQPSTYLRHIIKKYIKQQILSGEIRGHYKFTQALKLIKKHDLQTQLEQHLKYFFIERYFKEKDDVWRYADQVLEQTNLGGFDHIERNTYHQPTKKWIHEEMVFELATKIYKNYGVISQHKPFFLKSSFGGQMSYDVFISKLNIAIEYQGKQHFEPVEFFGGEEAFKKQQLRDEEKKKLSAQHGVRLIYINYDEPITEALLKSKINNTKLLKEI